MSMKINLKDTFSIYIEDNASLLTTKEKSPP